MACLDRTFISCYIFSERLKLEVFKTKNALKNLNEEKHWQYENEESETPE